MGKPGQLLEDSLLIIWNNRDSAERLKAMEQIYRQDIRFFENDSGNPIVGFEAINNLITRLHSGWAPEFVFELSKPSQTNHNVQVVAWRLGAPADMAVASGMDVAIIEHERIRALHLYLD